MRRRCNGAKHSTEIMDSVISKRKITADVAQENRMGKGESRGYIRLRERFSEEVTGKNPVISRQSLSIYIIHDISRLFFEITEW